MNPFLMQAQAFGRVVGADGTTTALRGATVARTGAGVYTITLDRLLDRDEGMVVVTPEAADRMAAVVDTSDTVKTVTISSDAGADADSDFHFVVLRL